MRPDSFWDFGALQIIYLLTYLYNFKIFRQDWAMMITSETNLQDALTDMQATIPCDGTVRNYLQNTGHTELLYCVWKNIPDTFDCNLKKDYQMLCVFLLFAFCLCFYHVYGE